MKNIFLYLAPTSAPNNHWIGSTSLQSWPKKGCQDEGSPPVPGSQSDHRFFYLLDPSHLKFQLIWSIAVRVPQLIPGLESAELDQSPVQSFRPDLQAIAPQSNISFPRFRTIRFFSCLSSRSAAVGWRAFRIPLEGSALYFLTHVEKVAPAISRSSNTWFYWFYHPEPIWLLRS